MDQPDIEVLQRYADAFQRDHRRAGEEFYADDIVLRVPGRHRGAGQFHGRDAVIGAIAAISDATYGTIGSRRLRGAAFADVRRWSGSPRPGLEASNPVSCGRAQAGWRRCRRRVAGRARRAGTRCRRLGRSQDNAGAGGTARSPGQPVPKDRITNASGASSCPGNPMRTLTWNRSAGRRSGNQDHLGELDPAAMHAEEVVAECDAKLERYRQTLDAGLAHRPTGVHTPKFRSVLALSRSIVIDSCGLPDRSGSPHRTAAAAVPGSPARRGCEPDRVGYGVPTGRSRYTRGWPWAFLPLATIQPRSLIPTACSRRMPVPAGIRVLRSICVPSR
jgi:hypothetical protein